MTELLPWWRRALQAMASPPAPRLQAPRFGQPMRGRRYESAAGGRVAAGWATSSAGPNSEVDAARATLRDRSRDLARNSALANRALTVLASSLVGEGIRPSPNTGSDRVDRILLDLWASLGLAIDVDGRHDVYGLQVLATRAWLESGEALMRRRWRRPDDGLPVPMQIQLLEPDLLVDTIWPSTATPQGARVQYGVEFDAIGRRVAYQMFRQHPGEVMTGASYSDSVMVPASEVSHVYHVTRPGQIRGVPWLAQVMLDLRDLDDLEHAEIVRQKMQACLAMFRETPVVGERIGLGSDDDVEQDDDGAYIETLRPGMVVKLPPGEQVKFLSPQQFGGFVQACTHYQRLISVGAQVPYELLTGDLSQVNYSSIRAGDLEFRRLVGVLRRQVVIPHICAPAWRWVVEAATLSGQVPALSSAQLAAALAPNWHPPRWVAIDREAEIKADVLEIQAGLRTHEQAAAERGMDWGALVTRLAAEHDEAEALGLSLLGFTDLSPSQSAKMPAPTASAHASSDDNVSDDSDDSAAA